MSKLDGEFVPLRKDIKDHLKHMSLSEIALFVAYLVLPVHEHIEEDGTVTGITDPTIAQLEEVLPIKKAAIIYAKQALAARGFIRKVGQSKVEIPKYKKLKSADFEPKSAKEELLRMSADSLKSLIIELLGSTIEPKSLKVAPSKEEEGELLTPPSGTGQATQMELKSLQKLKGVKDYPFDYETDLEHLRTLSVDFPDVEIHAEIKKWATYKVDKPLGKNSNPRLQTRNWMEKSLQFRKGGEYGRPNKADGGNLAGEKGKYDHLKV